jgi:hypothetical protein
MFSKMDFGKGIGLLEHHPDAHAHLDRVHRLGQHVHAVRLQARSRPVTVARVEVVHAVEAAQEGRLAAARGPDQRRDLVLVQIGM